jgi:hypothetical protein
MDLTRLETPDWTAEHGPRRTDARFDVLAQSWSDGRPSPVMPWSDRRKPKARRDRPAEELFPFGSRPLAPLAFNGATLPVARPRGSDIGLRPPANSYPKAYAEAASRGPGAATP